MKFTYPKREKLKSRAVISQLFSKSHTVMNHPIRLLSIETLGHHEDIQVAVTVSKRNFKRAVDRNRIKRQLREAYRLNQNILKSKSNKSFAFMIMFVGKKCIPSIHLQEKVKEAFEKWQPK